MAKRPRSTRPAPAPAPDPEPPQLNQSLERAQSLIAARMGLGEQLMARDILQGAALEEAWEDFKIWDDFNRELLRKLFSNDSISAEYSRVSGFVGILGHTRSLREKVDDFREDVRKKIGRLKSINERLQLYAPEEDDSNPTGSDAAPEFSRRVFVVHGHDNHLKTEVARLLERLDFTAVILHEQPNRGRTIIEKFENYSDVGFAVVLLTPDDVGGLAPSGDEKPDLVARARQNVIFEMGFFIGRLSRDRVVALHRHPTELLSDISGVIYTAVDSNGRWKYDLAKELEAADYVVDMSKIV